MKVDLPDPDGPTTVTNSPSGMSRVTPRSARTTWSPTWYSFSRFRTPIMRGCSFLRLIPGPETRVPRPGRRQFVVAGLAVPAGTLPA